MKNLYLIGSKNIYSEQFKKTLRLQGINVTSIVKLSDFINQKSLLEKSEIVILLDAIPSLDLDAISKIKSKFNKTKLLFIFIDRKKTQEKIDKLIISGEFYIVHFYQEDLVSENLKTQIESLGLGRSDYTDVENLLSNQAREKTIDRVETVRTEIRKEYMNNKVILLSNHAFDRKNNKEIIKGVSQLAISTLIIDLDFSHTNGFSFELTNQKAYNITKIEGLLEKASVSSMNISKVDIKSSVEKFSNYKDSYYMPAPRYITDRKNIGIQGYVNLISKAKEFFNLIVINVGHDLTRIFLKEIYLKANSLVMVSSEDYLNIDLISTNYEQLKAHAVIPRGLETILHVNNMKGKIHPATIKNTVANISDNLKISLSQQDLIRLLNIPNSIVPRQKKSLIPSFLKKKR